MKDQPNQLNSSTRRLRYIFIVVCFSSIAGCNNKDSGDRNNVATRPKQQTASLRNVTTPPNPAGEPEEKPLIAPPVDHTTASEAAVQVKRVSQVNTTQIVESKGELKREQDHSDAPKSTNKVEDAKLLTQWSGDLDHLPSTELRDEGWAALESAAEEGHMEAQFRIGILMLMTKPSENVRFEPIDGLAWLDRAANQGHALAARELAAFYYDGILIQQDRSKAKRLYELGAATGDADCLYYLGSMNLEQGQIESAVAELTKAAKQGHALSQLQLGELYLEGRGVSKDQQKAEQWYLKSARSGNAIAQYNVGMMYYFRGQIGKAKPWLAASSKQGFVDAMTNLSVIYFDEDNFDSAEHYASQAIAHGSVDAISMRMAIQRQRNLVDSIQEGIYSTGFTGY